MTDLYLDKHCAALMCIHRGLHLHRMSAVWCRPESRNDESLCLPGLDRFEGFIWLATDGAATSQAIRDVKRAFGYWRLRRSDVCDAADVFIGETRYYSDIARITPENRVQLEPLLASWQFGECAHIFFISPHRSHGIRVIAQPLEDLWSLRRRSDVIDERLELSGHLERHIDRAVDADGMAVISVRDSNVKQMFVLIGLHQQIDEWFGDIRSQIEGTAFRVVDGQTFSSWCAVGLSATCLG